MIWPRAVLNSCYHLSPLHYRLFVSFYFLAYLLYTVYLFFFSSRRRHTRCYRDWSSDVCSSDLHRPDLLPHARARMSRAALTASGPSRLSSAELSGQAASARKASRRTMETGIRKLGRSEERRVGKECRSRWAPDQ